MRKQLFLFLASVSNLLIFGQKDEYFMLVGTYTGSGSDGIYVYRFDNSTGECKYVSSVKTSNPSYLAVSPNNKFVYSANEDAPGSVTSLSFDATKGQLSMINQVSSHGRHPCYITVDKTGRWVIVGNYSSGTIAVYPVQKNGSIGTSSDTVQHLGYSVNSERQESAHVHSTFLSKDNKFLYVPDLGMDKVMIYKFNNKIGKLSPASVPFVITEAGSGPRHIDIHPNGKYAYLMEELTGSISVYEIEKDGFLNLVQNISGLPPDFTGVVGSADIHVSPDGKFVYCSNRGESNTIGILQINPSNGQLSPVGYESTLGKTPRNFNFDPSGNFLLVANQNSDEIVIFKRDKETGLLNDTGKRINVSKPVCIKWIKSE